jgi:predicted nucleic acid-binding protein
VILVDTSVWIDYFKGTENNYTTALDNALAEGLVLLGDLIYLEILQGFRSDSDFKIAKASLQALDHVELFGLDMVLKCAENYRKLRKRGITIRKSSDVIIASYCMDKKLPLLFQDRDFKPFVEHQNLIPALEET